MAYITIATAAGHMLMVQPKRQRILMFDLQDAAVAESRLNDRRLNYERYRSLKEMPVADFGAAVTFAQSMKRDFSCVSKDDLREIDNGVIELSKDPYPRDSEVKHYRWFKGKLRRKIIGNFPLIYTLSRKRDGILLLRLGIRRWPDTRRTTRKRADKSRQASEQ
jgi:hypothetical protein